ncbi:restriction endonuclease subunit S [Saccharothrix sp. 6-C]|uniref:restriction endonuclease subunit S n=1 Tax=Saccharothrix sp. 6-C TaxID=2781735 RepID=UPI0019173141|nr:restriction endonuclease subunit S [Saccharothrix sp. 6-C]QQQ77402.1 restriction endonuclease subunit S [Saccharothrix sp. 6-C]
MIDSIRLKWLLTESDVRAGAEAEALPLLSVSISWGVRRREASDTTTRAASEDLSNYKLCRAGDLVINRMRAFQGALGIAPEDGVVSPDYAVLRVDATVDKRWLNYFLTSGFTVATMASLVRGIGGTEAGNVRTPRLNISELQSMTAPLVPADEQRAIADYLDRETARIDTLIEEQQRLIEMLRERRVATIAEELNGYDVTRLRRLVDRERPMTYGILQCGPPVDGGVVYVGPSDIVGEGRSPERVALRTTAPEIAAAYQRSVLAGGDVIVSIGPAYGKVAVVSDELAGGNLTQDTVRVALRHDLVDTRFVVWVLLSRQTTDYWDREIMGATFRRLNLGTLAKTPIPLPSLEEQRRIAAYLDQQTAKIDMLIAETERFIELARERRAALITAAVTGQTDVREMV